MAQPFAIEEFTTRCTMRVVAQLRDLRRPWDVCASYPVEPRDGESVAQFAARVISERVASEHDSSLADVRGFAVEIRMMPEGEVRRG